MNESIDVEVKMGRELRQQFRKVTDLLESVNRRLEKLDDLERRIAELEKAREPSARPLAPEQAKRREKRRLEKARMEAGDRRDWDECNRIDAAIEALDKPKEKSDVD